MEDQITQMTSTTFLGKLAVFMEEGGVFMWVILAFWCFGVAIALERFFSLRRYGIKGKPLMDEIKKYVINNDVAQAIAFCSNAKSILPNVLKSGLMRANQSKEQISDAVEVKILETMPKVEKRLPSLILMANVSTLLGLLGTIYGLTQSFAAVAASDPASKAKLLALGISKAMNTTALGLISAISLMLIHSLLSGKAEKILSDMNEYSIKLIDLLGTRKGVSSRGGVSSREAA
ncbi:MAG: MotA/TolQ/ExbB proton channel family protein [Bacteriovoracales bacterium]|nr:MotA/TolQ/ExbB proton channel family protein [Bacteriovoracales bacterium]